MHSHRASGRHGAPSTPRLCRVPAPQGAHSVGAGAGRGQRGVCWALHIWREQCWAPHICTPAGGCAWAQDGFRRTAGSLSGQTAPGEQADECWIFPPTRLLQDSCLREVQACSVPMQTGMSLPTGLGLRPVPARLRVGDMDQDMAAPMRITPRACRATIPWGFGVPLIPQPPSECRCPVLAVPCAALFVLLSVAPGCPPQHPGHRCSLPPLVTPQHHLCPLWEKLPWVLP